MRIVMFCHSLVSDWNHGNAHFLRGIATELLSRGHEVAVYEPGDAWSVRRLLADHGASALDAFARAYPHLSSTKYDLETLDIPRALRGADLVLVHEWNDPGLVAALGDYRAATGGFRLLFHDTHHRTVSDRQGLASFDLRHYDGVLAFGRVIRNRYLSEGWTDHAWTWHEAADTRVFRPVPDEPRRGDLVWIGNWGDDEREDELREYLLEPVRRLGLRATVYGVRYPERALDALAAAGIVYGGWLPNFEVPRVFARYAVTVHVPRRPYARALPGVPTIRPFEALACGIPLVSAPWEDVEGLFHAGRDYALVRSGDEMTEALARLLANPDAAREMAEHGRATILRRHTCAHRVDELLGVLDELGQPARMEVRKWETGTA